MSSYHLPIIVGQNQSERIVMVHLVDGKENYEENRVVITSIGDHNTPLFKISNEAKYIFQSGSMVKPHFDKGDNHLEVCVGEDLIEPRRSNSFWNYCVRSDEFDDKVLFSVAMDFNGIVETYKGSLHIVRTSSTEVMKINADLGSDATQINYYIEGRGMAGSQPINLVKCFRDAYASSRAYSTLESPERESLFMQQEAGSTDFYKTGNITFQVDGNIDEPIDNTQTFINYINVSAAGKNLNAGKGSGTWDKEIIFSRKLINIKMLYSHINMQKVKSPVSNVSFHDNTLTSMCVINRLDLLKVLQAIYKQLIKVSTEGIAKECKLFSVLLLVPNIYIQENIELLLYELNKLNKNNDGRKYDFRIISESDSAFVGIKEARMEGGNETILGEVLSDITDLRLRDTFLIIDAGKGTTDYSIIRYDSEANNDANNSMVSLKRGGIVGAGGAIDYVFARVFARQVYNHVAEIVSNTTNLPGKSEFTHRFMTMIEKLQPRDQDRMMLFVEMLKKNYKDGNDVQRGTTAKVYSCFAKSNASAIIAGLLKTEVDYAYIRKAESAWEEVAGWEWDNNSIENLDDVDKSEVDGVCEDIASTIINKMIFAKGGDSLTRQIDYVIFNGRSFLFTPLKDAFEKAIMREKRIWWENWGIKTLWLWCLSEKQREYYKNLKTAPLNGIDMKAVSVQFDEHDLGVNCNSNLCCMDGIVLRGDEAFGQEMFWKGFTSVKGKQATTHYYIGYVSNKGAIPFAPTLNQKKTLQVGDVREKLVLMTLFPVRYEPVYNDNGTSTTTSPNPTTPTSQSRNDSAGKPDTVVPTPLTPPDTTNTKDPDRIDINDL